jgi:hypothetical protein
MAMLWDYARKKVKAHESAKFGNWLRSILLTSDTIRIRNIYPNYCYHGRSDEKNTKQQGKECVL